MAIREPDREGGVVELATKYGFVAQRDAPEPPLETAKPAAVPSELTDHRLLRRQRMIMLIRYTTDDNRSAEQALADDHVREQVERTGGAWALMSTEQRAQLRARMREKKRRAEAARARKEAEQRSLEERIALLEKRVARLEG